MTRRRLSWLAAAALAVCLLAACSTVSSLIDTTRALQAAGYQSVHVGFHSPGNKLSVSVSLAHVPVPGDTDGVAQVVWSSFHEHFDELTVKVSGSGPAVSRTYAFSEMVTQFGSRNPSWDSTSIDSGVKQLGVVTIGIVVGLFVVVLVIVLLVLRRNRRRRPPAPFFPGVPPYGHPGAGYPGPYGAYPPFQGPQPGFPPAPQPGSPPGAQPPGWYTPPKAPPSYPSPPGAPPAYPPPPGPPRDDGTPGSG